MTGTLDKILGSLAGLCTAFLSTSCVSLETDVTQRRSDASIDLDTCGLIRIVDPDAGVSGTGVSIERDLVLTNWHNVEDATSIEVNGRPCEIEILDHGNVHPDEMRRPRGYHGDWAVIRADAIELPDPPSFRRIDGVPAGSAVVVAGYFGGLEAPIPIKMARRLGRAAITMRVVEPPGWLPSSMRTEGMLFLEAPQSRETYHGLSGSPAFLYNEETGEHEVIGVYRGTVRMKPLIGEPIAVHSVILLPDEVELPVEE